MPVMIATFGKPEDIMNPSFDGKIFRFPLTLIDRNDVGTPPQPSKTKSLKLRVEVSDSRIKTWGLGQCDLITQNRHPNVKKRVKSNPKEANTTR